MGMTTPTRTVTIQPITPLVLHLKPFQGWVEVFKYNLKGGDMRKLFVLGLCLLFLVGCGASYNRLPDGSVTAKDGTLLLTYSPDGKVVIAESFIPNDPSNFITKMINAGQTGNTLTPAVILQLLQGLTPSKP